jgi:hypothetical protein
MDALKFISIVVLAVLAAAAQTDKAHGFDHAPGFQGGQCVRAEVRSEAARANAARNHIQAAARPYGFVDPDKARGARYEPANYLPGE